MARAYAIYPTQLDLYHYKKVVDKCVWLSQVVHHILLRQDVPLLVFKECTAGSQGIINAYLCVGRNVV